eukprot:scaffold126_cov178-Amphora_coffeaeformis.AAC.10
MFSCEREQERFTNTTTQERNAMRKDSIIIKYGIVAFCFTLVAAFSSSELKNNHQRPSPTTTTTTTTLFQKASAMKGPPAQPPRPNPCTYWVSDHLMAGEHPTDKRGVDHSRAKLARYLDAGISVFIDLTEPGQKPAYQDLVQEVAQAKDLTAIEYHRLAVPDFGIPSVSLMKQILDTIDDAVARDKKVYVHCAGGIGRTGTTVGCYLVRHGNDGTTALQEVNRLFQHSERRLESFNSPETREQMNFVRNWEESSSTSG